MLIYGSNSATAFGGPSRVGSYKSASKRRRVGNRSKTSKRVSRRRRKVGSGLKKSTRRKTRKRVTRRRRSARIKKLKLKNINFLKKLGLRVKKR